MWLCQYDREDCWKRNLKRALFSKRSLKVWHKGFSCWMTVTKLLKLACWTQLPYNQRKPDIAKSRDIDFISGLKSHITSTVEQKRNY